MLRIKHRSIKVTLFSEKHIKIFSKIILTYHQIAPSITLINPKPIACSPYGLNKLIL